MVINTLIYILYLEMKFIIGSNNLKIFCKSISSLAKIGDEIYVEPLKDSVIIKDLIKLINFNYYFCFLISS